MNLIHKINLNSKIIAYVFLGLFFLQLLLLVPVQTYFASFSWLRVFQIFVFFLTFAFSVFKTGIIFQKVVHRQTDSLTALSYGSIVFSFLAFFLGLLSLIGNSYSFLFHCIIILPIFIDVYISKNDQRSFETTSKVKFGIPFYVLALFISYKLFFSATLLSPALDHQYYHLLAPKLWHDAGIIKYIENFNLIYLSGFWEFFYLLPFQIFTTPVDEGIIEVQLFSQLMHTGIGLVGSLMVFYRILSLFLSNFSLKILTLLLFALTVDGHWTAFTPKNDWGILLWVLTGIYILLLVNRNKWISFLFIGTAVISKFTLILPLTPILVIILFSNFNLFTKEFIFKTLLISLLPLTWPLVKYFQVNNPMYPGLLFFFKDSRISEELTFFFNQSSKNIFSFKLLLRRLKEIAFNSPLNAIIVLTPFFMFKNRQIRALSYIFLLSFILLVRVHSHLLCQRHFLLMYTVVSLLVVLIIDEIINKFKTNTSLTTSGLSILAIIISLNYTYDELKYHSSIFKRPNKVLIDKGQRSAFYLFLKEKYKNKKIAFSISIDDLLYVSDQKFHTVRQDIDLSNAIKGSNCLDEVLKHLKNNGYEYYYDQISKIPFERASIYLRQNIIQCKNAISFINPRHLLINIDKYISCLRETDYFCDKSKHLNLTPKYFSNETYNYYQAPDYHGKLKTRNILLQVNK